MRIEAKMYGESTDGAARPAVPAPIYRMSQWIVQTVAVIMRAFSIEEVKLELAQSGPVPVSNIKFTPLMDDSLPKSLAVMRVDILRGILKTAFERFGLGTVKITLTDDERKELLEYWRQLETGAVPTADTDGVDIEISNIPLPVEADPGEPPEVEQDGQ
jgi:hypothetical protein